MHMHRKRIVVAGVLCLLAVAAVEGVARFVFGLHLKAKAS